MSLPWCQPESREIDWLRSQNLLDAALNVLPRIGAASVVFLGNVFEEASDGQRALTFPIHDCGKFIDFAAWRPRTGQLGTWCGVGFAIGQDQIFNPATYFDGGALRVHRTPLDWLRADRDGIVIVKPELTYAYLRNVRRLSFADPAHARHVERWLEPPRGGPELLIEVVKELAA
jgi:hypothetical protein